MTVCKSSWLAINLFFNVNDEKLLKCSLIYWTLRPLRLFLIPLFVSKGCVHSWVSKYLKDLFCEKLFCYDEHLITVRTNFRNNMNIDAVHLIQRNLTQVHRTNSLPQMYPNWVWISTPHWYCKCIIRIWCFRMYFKPFIYTLIDVEMKMKFYIEAMYQDH